METNQVEILLVEGNLEVAVLTIHALEKVNLANKLVHLRSGGEALEYIFATGAYTNRKIEDVPRVILLDINAPKANGIGILNKIRSDERTRLIPVVILASSLDDVDIFESYNIDVNNYIVKPVD